MRLRSALVLACVALGGRTAEAQRGPAGRGQQPSATWTLDVSDARPLAPAGTDLHRIVGAAVIDDIVVIANAGTHQLLFFDTTGAFLFARGHEGGGPGEFRALAWVKPCRGGVATWDDRNTRLTLWNASGNRLRDWSLPGSPPGITRVPIGVVDSCKVIVRLGRSYDEPPRGVFAPPTAIVVLEPGGPFSTDTLLAFDGRRVYVHDHGSGSSVNSMPFQPAPFVLSRGEELIFGTAEELAYVVIDLSGAQRQSVRETDARRVRLPADSIGAYRERRISRSPESFRRMATEVANAMPMPDHLPAVSQAQVDALGNVWLQEGGLDTLSRWLVFDGTGDRIAEVAIPRRYRLVSIADTWIVTVHTDEDDVEYASLVPLDKNGA